MVLVMETQWTIPECFNNWSCSDKTREQVYFTILELQPCTAKQIADHLGWSINRVTGRITELQTAFNLIEVLDQIQGEYKKEKRYIDKKK